MEHDDCFHFTRMLWDGYVYVVMLRCRFVLFPLSLFCLQEEQKEELDKEEWWRVILHNDEIHTFDYVTQSITRVRIRVHYCL